MMQGNQKGANGNIEYGSLSRNETHASEAGRGKKFLSRPIWVRMLNSCLFRAIYSDKQGTTMGFELP